MELINNTTKTLRDDLSVEIKEGSKLSIAAACFSIYAFQELKKQLSDIDELRFIFTSPTFITEKAKKEKREFYIPRLNRERSLYGTEFEIKLRNELTQKAIAKECAEWIKKKVSFKSTLIDDETANAIEFYLIQNGYVDMKRKVTDKYRQEIKSGTVAELPDELKPMAEGIHTLIQSVYDDSILQDMFTDGHETKVKDNPLNDNFAKKEFQALWREINHKYAYTVEFDSDELIKKATAHIDEKLFVSELQYTTTIGRQKAEMNEYEVERGASFTGEKTRTQTLKHAETSQIKYDLIGKVAEGTTLTRKTVSAILQGIRADKLYMFKNNPEEFITKVIRLINEQKATMIVEHISYDTIEGEYDSTIFTAEKNTQSFDKAFLAKKAIQDYVFTDGSAEQSIERRFAEDLDAAEEVCVYAKLPRTFQIPTPVGNYSPDWAIAFYEGTVKHIFFVAETKGTMETLNLRPIEQAKISCAKKLFNEMSNSKVVYHDVDSYQSLLNIMNSI